MGVQRGEESSSSRFPCPVLSPPTVSHISSPRAGKLHHSFQVTSETLLRCCSRAKKNDLSFFLPRAYQGLWTRRLGNLQRVSGCLGLNGRISLSGNTSIYRFKANSWSKGSICELKPVYCGNAVLIDSVDYPPITTLDSAPNIGPLISRWELDKFKHCCNKNFRTSKIRTILYQQFLNLLISQRDMSGPILGALSNNRWLGVVNYSEIAENIRWRAIITSTGFFEIVVKWAYDKPQTSLCP